MPIYMDRHDVSDSVTAEMVAHLHQEDLKIQHEYDCRGLTYWFDENRKTAFCLLEAPNEQAIIDMHKHAHGEIPHHVLEVNASIVESFLGRIEDPEKAINTDLNIINDPAFRTLIVINLKRKSFRKLPEKQIAPDFENQINSITKSVLEFNGRVVKCKNGYFLLSFESVSNAVLCAIEIKHRRINNVFEMNIGISAGVPITGRALIFEETIRQAERLCAISKSNVFISSNVNDLYTSENLNTTIKDKSISFLMPREEIFVNQLFDFVENNWQNADLKVEDFNQSLGFSKTNLFRKMKKIFGMSPNTFLMNYRLNKALELFDKKTGNISEIAFNSGFSDPSYFSKCFTKKFGISPSDYLHLLV